MGSSGKLTLDCLSAWSHQVTKIVALCLSLVWTTKKTFLMCSRAQTIWLECHRFILSNMLSYVQTEAQGKEIIINTSNGFLLFIIASLSFPPFLRLENGQAYILLPPDIFILWKKSMWVWEVERISSFHYKRTLRQVIYSSFIEM